MEYGSPHAILFSCGFGPSAGAIRPSPGDGFRLLICRIRPRGVSKQKETWSAWWPDLGPSRAAAGRVSRQARPAHLLGGIFRALPGRDGRRAAALAHPRSGAPRGSRRGDHLALLVRLSRSRALSPDAVGAAHRRGRAARPAARHAVVISFDSMKKVTAALWLGVIVAAAPVAAFADDSQPQILNSSAGAVSGADRLGGANDYVAAARLDADRAERAAAEHHRHPEGAPAQSAVVGPARAASTTLPPAPPPQPQAQPQRDRRHSRARSRRMPRPIE